MDVTLIIFICSIHTQVEIIQRCTLEQGDSSSGEGNKAIKGHLRSLPAMVWGGALSGMTEGNGWCFFQDRNESFLPGFIFCSITIALFTGVIWLGFLKSGKGSSRIQFVFNCFYIPPNIGNISVTLIILSPKKTKPVNEQQKWKNLLVNIFKALSKSGPLSFIT